MQGSPCLFGETESQFLLYRQRKLWKLHEKPEEKGSGFPQYRDGSILFWGIYFHVFGGRDGDLKKRRAGCGNMRKFFGGVVPFSGDPEKYIYFCMAGKSL